MALITDDTELLLKDPAEWRRRRGLNPDDVAGDPDRIRNAMGVMQEVNQSPDRQVTGVMEGSTAGGRPFFAMATNRVPQATAGAIPPARPAAEDPAAIRAAMGQPVAPAPDAVPGGDPTGTGMGAIPARDRLTLAMWGNSRDTGGMRRYNEVAKRYGMALKEIPKTEEERRRLAATGGDWRPTAGGGMGNLVTGDINAPAAQPDPIDWNKRMLKQPDGTYLDPETKTVIGTPAKPEIDWNKRIVVGADKIPRDMGDGGKQVGGNPPDEIINLGEGRLYNATQKAYVKPDGTPDPRKDVFQGRLVKIKMGKDTYKVGIYNPKNGIYENWQDVVKGGTKGTVMTSPDGTTIAVGGDAGKDVTDVPDFVDEGKKATSGTKGTPGTGTTKTRPVGARWREGGKIWVMTTNGPEEEKGA